MYRFLPIVILALVLLTAAPVDAQLRAELPPRVAPAAVYTQPSPGLSLGNLFNSETLKFSHGYEFSYNSFGGEGIGIGVYSTSMRWQPTDRLAARVDVGLAHSPFGSSMMQQQLGFSQDQPARVFLQNASIAYRPTENSVLTLSFSQSPYGGYFAPFGMTPLGPHGGTSFRAGVAPAGHDAMFWRNSP